MLRLQSRQMLWLFAFHHISFQSNGFEKIANATSCIILKVLVVYLHVGRSVWVARDDLACSPN